MASHAISDRTGGDLSTLGAGIAEHAAAASQPVRLEPAGSQQFSSVIQNLGERVAAASACTRSEGGARSASGIVSAAASLLGLRFETVPPQGRAEQTTSLIDQDVWVDPRSIQSNAQFLGADRAGDDDAMHHRSISEAGTPGQPNIATPQTVNGVWYPEKPKTAVAVH